jgi:hypothetical protein
MKKISKHINRLSWQNLSFRFLEEAKFKQAFSVIILALLFFASNATYAHQQAYSFQSSLSTDTILIGDHVELRLTAIIPKKYEVQFPFFADTIITGIEVLGLPKIDTLVKRSGQKELTYHLLLTSFDEGYYRIPRILLLFSDGEKVDTALTSPIWLMVNTLPPDTTKAIIYDIKMPYSEPITFAEVAPWIGLGLLIAAIVTLLVLYLIKRKKGEKIFFPTKRTEPPHVVALRQLEKLKEQKLWNTDNHKHYYTLLTDIIRYYIEGRFGVSAMEQTTYEIISSIRKGELIRIELIEKLQDTLSLADLVKFARFKPEVSENEVCLDFGFRFVNETKVEEVLDEEEDLSIDNPEKSNNEDINEYVEPIKSTEK